MGLTKSRICRIRILKEKFSERFTTPFVKWRYLQVVWIAGEYRHYKEHIQRMDENEIIKRIIESKPNITVKGNTKLTPWFMEPGGSILHSLRAFNNPYPELNQSNSSY